MNKLQTGPVDIFLATNTRRGAERWPCTLYKMVSKEKRRIREKKEKNK